MAAEKVWLLCGGHGPEDLLGGCTVRWRGLGLKQQNPR